jgi:hypothetical protein
MRGNCFVDIDGIVIEWFGGFWVFWCLTPFSKIFQIYRGGKF